jgi:hypothetical protein
VQLVQPPPLELELVLDDDPLALLLAEADDVLLLLDDAVVVPLLDDAIVLPPPDEVDACSPLDDEPRAPPLPTLPAPGVLEPQAAMPTTAAHAQPRVMATARRAALALDDAVAT